MLRSVGERGADERGAVLVVTAFALPMLVALGALSLGSTALWTSRQDLQRAADLGALAAAASAPTVNVDGTVSTLPFGPQGATFVHDLFGEGGGDGWNEWGCTVARRQFEGERSVVTKAIVQTPEGAEVLELQDSVDCTVRWSWEDPLLAALGACAADLLARTDCAQELRTQLAGLVPAMSELDPVVDPLFAALGTGDDTVDDALAQLRALPDVLLADLPAQQAAIEAELETLYAERDSLEQQLLDPLLEPVTALLLQEELDAVNAQIAELEAAAGDLDAMVDTINNEIAPLVAAIEGELTAALAPDGTFRVGVELADLLPALVTPRVSVSAEDVVVRPPLSPWSFPITTGATARRAIKSAVVLPTFGVPGLAPGAWELLPEATRTELQERLCTSDLLCDARAQVEQAGDHGFVLDPNQLTPHLYPGAADRAADVVERLETELGPPLFQALAETCGGWDLECPSPADVVDEDRMFGVFRQDLEDATRPPPSGTAPSLDDVLADAADTGDPLWVVSGLDPILLAQHLSDPTMWDQLASHPLLTGIALPDLSFIPALDAVPATVHRDPETGLYAVRPVDLADALATKGLYQGRLVR